MPDNPYTEDPGVCAGLAVLTGDGGPLLDEADDCGMRGDTVMSENKYDNCARTVKEYRPDGTTWGDPTSWDDDGLIENLVNRALQDVAPCAYCYPRLGAVTACSTHAGTVAAWLLDDYMGRSRSPWEVIVDADMEDAYWDEVAKHDD